MNVIDRWYLLLADLRMRMESGAYQPGDLYGLIAEHATNKCEYCTSELCCDFMRLSTLTWRAVHARNNI